MTYIGNSLHFSDQENVAMEFEIEGEESDFEIIDENDISPTSHSYVMGSQLVELEEEEEEKEKEKEKGPPSFHQESIQVSNKPLPDLPKLNFEADSPQPSPKSDDSFEDVNKMEATVFKDKGLTNEMGENNCFLNGLLQVLMHNNSFRRLVMSTDHSHSPSTLCVLCKIKDIFIDYKFSDSDRIPGNALRKTLALIYEPQSKFQLRDMADASDCLEAILNRLHLDMSKNNSKCHPPCPAHKIFAVETIERTSCPCGLSRSNENSSFVQYFVVDEVIDTAKAINPLPVNWERRFTSEGLAYYANLTEKSTHWRPPKGYGIENLNENSDYSFASLLSGVSLQQLISCQKETCHFKSPLIRKLVKIPQTLSIGFNWLCEDPEKFKVTDSWHLIQPYMSVSQLFEEVPEEFKYEMMNLKGIVCFYGRHYIALSFSNHKKKWLMFDDTSVRDVGVSFEEVSRMCIKSKYQPCLLFFEKAD